MRKTRRTIIGYQATGESDVKIAEQVVRLRRQKEAYDDFSKAAHLRPKLERTATGGYDRSISSMAVWRHRRVQAEADRIFRDLRSGEYAMDLLLNDTREPFMQERLDFIEKYTGEKGFIPNRTYIKHSKTIAQGEEIRIVQRLVNEYGGVSKNWTKRVGRVDSKKYYHDVHWYEYENKQYDMKMKERVGKMRTVDVYQCVLDRTIPLEYIGKVKYSGVSFGVDSLTDGKEYIIVKNRSGSLAVVDDSEEDYLYDLSNPRPANGSSPGGKFKVIDDPLGILAELVE